MLHIVLNFILKSPHKLSQSIFLNESLTLCFVYIKTFHLTKINTISVSIVHFGSIPYLKLYTCTAMLTASIASPKIKRILPYIFLFFFLISTAPIIEIKIGTIYRKQNRKNIITSIKNVKSISSIILSHLSLV